MSIFEDFLTEDELLAEFKKKKIPIGNKRTLRGWRQQRTGPPWVKFKQIIVYPADTSKHGCVRACNSRFARGELRK
jgi:hypothetical protein